MNHKQRVMPLAQAVNEIKLHKAILHYDNVSQIDLWSPNTPLPISLRRSVTRHKEQLKQMMNDGRIEVCSSADLHRQFWKYDAGNGKYICDACIKIDRSFT